MGCLSLLVPLHNLVVLWMVCDLETDSDELKARDVSSIRQGDFENVRVLSCNETRS